MLSSLNTIAMRALFVTGSMSPGGAEHHTIALMNGLTRRGHECHAVYVKRGTEALLDKLQLSDASTVRCLEAERYFDWRAIKSLAQHFAGFRPSIVVAANPYALLYAWAALRLARCKAPLATVFHSTQVRSGKELAQMAAYAPLFWTTNCAVFVSERQRRHWARRGISARRNEVIHNGVDLARFEPAIDDEARRALRARYGCGDGDYVIGIAAMLRPEKNHVQLLDAVSRLRGMGIPARALLIGDGEVRPVIEARAAQLNIQDYVHIAGLQKDVRPFVQAADVMVLCSHTEAFSLAAIEAMALGRAVIHSDVGGAPEMIIPGENGYLFPVGDTETFVDKLAILANPVASRRMGQAARKVVEANFSEEKMIDRYEDMMLGLCRRPAPGAIRLFLDSVRESL